MNSPSGQQAPAAAGYRLEGLAGSWVNSDPESRGIAQMALAVRSGVPTARIVGRGAAGWVDWGEAAVRSVYAEGPERAAIAGCLLDYDFGFARVHLQVQLKLGVAVVGSFIRLGEGGGGVGGFSREFLGRLPEGARAAAAIDDHDSLGPPTRPPDLAAGSDGGSPPDRGIVTGRWLNTAAAPRAITRLAIADEGASGMALELWGTGAPGAPAGWGREVAEPFGCVEEDRVPSICLLASYLLEDARVELQIRQNKGILAVTSFTRLRDPGAGLDHVARELFYRDGEPDRRSRP